ncbi:hypothetical protein J3A83DRAFT_2104417 [Scleroderma citrinum]
MISYWQVSGSFVPRLPTCGRLDMLMNMGHDCVLRKGSLSSIALSCKGTFRTSRHAVDTLWRGLTARNPHYRDTFSSLFSSLAALFLPFVASSFPRGLAQTRRGHRLPACSGIFLLHLLSMLWVYFPWKMLASAFA